MAGNEVLELVQKSGCECLGQAYYTVFAWTLKCCWCNSRNVSGSSALSKPRPWIFERRFLHHSPNTRTPKGTSKGNIVIKKRKEKKIKRKELAGLQLLINLDSIHVDLRERNLVTTQGHSQPRLRGTLQCCHELASADLGEAQVVLAGMQASQKTACAMQDKKPTTEGDIPCSKI